MSLRDDIVATARVELRTRYPGISRLGTRWQHQARMLGVALDCIGLVGAVGVRLGLGSARRWSEAEAFRSYGPEPDPAMLLAGCRSLLVPIAIADARDGDIYVCAQKFAPTLSRHFAFAASHKGERTMIHAETYSRRVVENGVATSANWLVTHAFRFPEAAA